MRPEQDETMSMTPLRDRMRSIDIGFPLPADLPLVFARRAAQLTARACLGESTPDAEFFPYQSRQTGRLAVYVWRAHAVRRYVAAQRLEQPGPEGAA